ncbi:putative protein-lysine deacylase ABHD14B isoform X2 [Uloborus diversus]|uniref:putative protein-lysine deacylase ABHD14B isoform X2 n=1 Tax=Uloborus diversus TaxID=327109 RepID=UPI00240A33C9|nr:putative protein-lysine deacylase ABHD14B isoform X2 [Uloborus diversus]
MALTWMSVGIVMYRTSSNKLNDVFEESTELFRIPLSPSEEIEACRANNRKLSPNFWKKVNLRKEKIPEEINEMMSAMVVQSDFIEVEDCDIHILYAKPASSNRSISVLLLHGQSYNSETWNTLGTLRNLAAFGYYTVAVDLPGFGRSAAINDLDRGQFLTEVITALDLKKPVIVSPSMSGAFSLKYLLNNSDKMAGFVPVAPVSMSIIDDSPCSIDDDDVLQDEDCQRIMHYLKKKPRLNCIKVPSLIVWGERDRGTNSAKLCQLPNGQGAEIPEGKHSAYLSNPNLWHKLLYNFLNIVDETFACR